ncbi:hypothetical protein CYY_001668 [Polysphondylium violaceum]|uniref:IPT/TIG domain-containing protein n=1 Tax=Polysphondylium violaceum TaxID=133409 RepID=A0A8J4Q908_9MYCE|nr:hypothetical protein CYY_001668 [Polysphondylium violaceum]
MKIIIKITNIILILLLLTSELTLALIPADVKVSVSGSIITFKSTSLVKNFSINTKNGMKSYVPTCSKMECTYDMKPLAPIYYNQPLNVIVSQKYPNGTIEDTSIQSFIDPQTIVYSISSPETKGSIVTVNGLFMMKKIDQLCYFFSMGADQNAQYYDAFIRDDVYSNAYVSIPAGSGMSTIYIDYTPYNITYQRPTITDSVANATHLTLRGNNFFNSIDLLNLTVTEILPTITKKDIVSIGHNQIVLKHSNVYSLSSMIFLKVNGLSLGQPFTQVFKPIIEKINSVGRKGGYVVVQGSFLNGKRVNGTKSVFKIKLGDFVCDASNQVDGEFNVATCKVPGNNKDNIKASVIVDGLESNQLDFSYAIPSLTSETNVLLNGLVIKPDYINEEETKLSLTLPEGAQSGEVVVKSTELKVTKPTIISLRPVVFIVSPPKTQGSTITITGLFLRNSIFNSSEILNVELKVAQLPTFTCKNWRIDPLVNPNVGKSMLCDASPGYGKNYNLSLTIGHQKTENIPFSYMKPILESMDQSYNSIVIRGENFGSVNQHVLIHFNNNTIVPTNTSHQSIVFTIPPLSKPDNMTVVVGGLESDSFKLSFKPVVSSVSNITTAGGNLTITGHFFPKNQSIIKVNIGSKEKRNEIVCENPTVVDTNNTMIVCSIPNGSGFGYSLNITLDGSPIQNPKKLYFSYDRPTILNCTTVNENGGLITIFGTSMNNPMTIKIGDRDCIAPNVTDYNTATCFLNPYDDQDNVPREVQTVLVLVNGQSDSKDIFSYDVPLERRGEAKAKRIKWLVPAIVIPCFIGVIALAIVIIILIKRYKRSQNLKKQLEN